MPVYNFSCSACKVEEEAYVPKIGEGRTCEACGGEMERVWKLGAAHRPGNAWPFTTTHLSGKPETFNSQAELDRRCKELGVTHRPDAGWLTKEFVGVDPRTGKHVYKEASGVGLPGCWV
jgi:predicted nucleic acid-binding Zn ribbon protein